MLPATGMTPDPTPGWQQPPPQAQTENPMAIHVKVIAILQLVWGIAVAVAALFVLFFFTVGSAAIDDSEQYGTPEWVAGAAASLGFLVAALLAGLAAVAILGSTRLLAHRRSGRVFTYISSALALLNFPIGTAFGIYAFVILTRPDTDRLLVDP
jgi:hypothetical protein